MSCTCTCTSQFSSVQRKLYNFNTTDGLKKDMANNTYTARTGEKLFTQYELVDHKKIEQWGLNIINKSTMSTIMTFYSYI